MIENKLSTNLNDFKIKFSRTIILFIISFFCINSIYSQKLSEAQIKSVYVYKFFSYVEWSAVLDIKQYVIGFMGNEPEMFDELTNMTKTQNVKGIPIKLIKISETENNQNINVLYIAKTDIQNIKNIIQLYNNKNTLLITNQCEDRTLVMINFVVKDKDKVQFEINKPNILFAKLSLSPNILLKGGTELDVAELYHKMEAELQNIKQTYNEQQDILKDLNKKIEIQNQLITNREAQLSEIQLKYFTITDSLKYKSQELLLRKHEILTKDQELNLKKTELLNQEQQFNLLLNNIEQYNQHITNQKLEIITQNNEINRKEQKLDSQNLILKNQIKQINKHKKIEEEQVKTIKNQNYVTLLIIMILIFVLVILIQYFKTVKKQKVTNKLISDKNYKLEKATEELNIAKLTAETANIAKTNFLSNMSHELRTPLNAILGYSQMLQREKNLTEKQIKNLSTVYSSGNHLLSLINDILDLGKIEAGRLELLPKSFNLNNLLRNVFEISQVKAEEKELFFKFEILSEIPNYVSGDEKRIKQILLNLLSNGIKYTHIGGVIYKAGYSDITTKTFRIEVEDTGEGIEQSKLEQIFESFTQVSNRRNYIEGTGLGLPITKQLVELMNGKISVKSQPDVGSVFVVEFPLEIISENLIDFSKIDSIITGYEGVAKSILIIDDNPANFSMTAELLERVGFEIYTAQSGREAIERLNEFVPDLILLDFVMPDLDGLDTINIIKESAVWNEVKIIGISATITGQIRQTEFIEKCHDFVQKPIELDVFFRSITKILNINWKYEKSNEINSRETIVKFKSISIFPTEDILNNIIENAKMGAFAKIENIIQTLKENEDYSGFCEKILYFTNNFDDDGIIQFINHKK